LIEDAQRLERIRSYILANDSLIKDRPGKPTRGGSQTHEIMTSKGEAMNRLKDLLQAELIGYANSLPEPIKTINGATYRLSGWGVSLGRLWKTKPDCAKISV
jgi:hypothetical protein